MNTFEQYFNPLHQPQTLQPQKLEMLFILSRFPYHVPISFILLRRWERLTNRDN